MDYFSAALALLSSLVGAGIVGLPYTFYHSGLAFGIVLTIIFALQVQSSCSLYFKAKDLTG